MMKTRGVRLETGETFTVPQGIQRIDTRATHGWQVRYQGTKFFSDGVKGADSSLEAAMRELLRRIASLPAPVTLQKGPSISKSSDLPPGISGPIVVPARRGARSRSAVLSVLLPRFGREPQIKSIYIGTEQTYSLQRFDQALARAIELRTEVIKKYEEAATRHKRKQGMALRSELRAARQAAAQRA